MKIQFLIAFFFALLFASCENDDGFRAVSIEMEFGAVQSAPTDTSLFPDNMAFANVTLYSVTPDTYLSLSEESNAVNGAVPKKTVKSEDVIWAVGTNVSRDILLSGQLEGRWSKLPCDMTIRIRADNKVIWSHSAKKGDVGFEEEANLIIR